MVAPARQTSIDHHLRRPAQGVPPRRKPSGL
jgi:hypothetical protein